MFPVIGIILVWPPIPRTMALLMLYMSSNIDSCILFSRHTREALGKEWKKTGRDLWAVIQKHCRRKKAYDSFLISVWNQKVSQRSGGGDSVAASKTSACCQESGNTLPPVDKTSFGLWQNHRWIILIFRRVLLACGEKVKTGFARPWHDDNFWIIHNVSPPTSSSQQICSSIFHEPVILSASAAKFRGFGPYPTSAALK